MGPSGPGTILYDDTFFTNTSGFADVSLSEVTLGIRRRAGATAVTVNFYAVPMTGVDESSMSGDLTGRLLLGSFSLGIQGTTALVPLTLSSLSATLPLNNQVMPGFGGMWIGVEYIGAGSPSDNTWRAVNNLAVGASSTNGFASSDPDPFTITSGFGANLYVDVNGELVTAVPEPSSIALLSMGVIVMLGCWRRRRR